MKRMIDEEILEEIYENGSDHGAFIDFLGRNTEPVPLQRMRDMFSEIEDPASIRFYGSVGKDLIRLGIVERLKDGYTLTGKGTDVAMERIEIHAGIRKVPATFANFDVYVRKENECTECGLSKPIGQKYCSLACAAKNSRKVDWDAIDLLALLETSTHVAVAEMLGVSDTTVHKRKKKILAGA